MGETGQVCAWQGETRASEETAQVGGGPRKARHRGSLCERTPGDGKRAPPERDVSMCGTILEELGGQGVGAGHEIGEECVRPQIRWFTKRTHRTWHMLYSAL